jgi:hypothetical protein
MEIYHFLNLFFYFEILILLFVFFFILIKRLFYFFGSKHNIKIRKKISNLISISLEKKSDYTKFSKLHHRFILIEVLEEFNRRISGEEWDTLKDSLCKKLLLPKARHWAKSFFWIKRNYSARIFALCPLKEDEKLICKLIDDPSFLVSGIAAYSATLLESEKGIILTLKCMDRQKGYSYYFYADALSKGSPKVYEIISSMASKFNASHKSCLDVLSLKTSQVPLNFLNKDLRSKDSSIKIAALKVAACNPQEEFEDKLIKLSEDDDPTVRAYAVKGLANFSNRKSCKALQNAALDPEWSVTYLAARSLKSLGKSELIKDSKLKRYINEFE